MLFFVTCYLFVFVFLYLPTSALIMDSDDALNDDPGIPTGTDRSPTNIDLGMNMELNPTMELRCINCTDVSHRRRHSLELEEVLSVIRQWIAPQVVTDSTVVCHTCWTLALYQSHQSIGTNDQPSTSGGHHRRHLLLEIINEKLNTNNDLADFVTRNNLNRRRAQFVNINVNINNVPFPRLELSALILIACGTYQLKQAQSYYAEHIRGDGSYTIEVCRDMASNLLEGYQSTENLTLLRGKIQSRHISRKIYYVYILYHNNESGREGIKQYCCNCMVGRRTVGCCAHVMTIIWYLSWARYQEHINRPAQFLDNILLTYESD